MSESYLVGRFLFRNAKSEAKKPHFWKNHCYANTNTLKQIKYAIFSPISDINEKIFSLSFV